MFRYTSADLRIMKLSEALKNKAPAGSQSSAQAPLSRLLAAKSAKMAEAAKPSIPAAPPAPQARPAASLEPPKPAAPKHEALLLPPSALPPHLPQASASAKPKGLVVPPPTSAQEAPRGALAIAKFRRLQRAQFRGNIPRPSRLAAPGAPAAKGDIRSPPPHAKK